MFVKIIQIFRLSFINHSQLHLYSSLAKMEKLLLPPKHVKGMVTLDRNAFTKKINVPYLDITEVDIKLSNILDHVRKYLLKLEHLKPVQSADRKIILLNPNILTKYTDLDVNALQTIGLSEDNFSFKEIELKYENWGASDILKSVLPDDEDNVTSFSRIGHIVHVNLREHVEKYKTLIGNVLLDKTPNCKTVVNKTQNIDNTYRNFQMELLCGENDFIVSVKENGNVFDFDFSLVYWNPRLSSEHERIVNMLKAGDILYDACAGVGPFSIPAAKKKCTVLANDLNPNCHKYLQANAKRNKVQGLITCFNKDARDFIKQEVKDDLISKWRSNFSGNIHVTMNLPAMAVEFLDVFKGLCKNESRGADSPKNMPTIHVYCFAKGEDTKKIAKELVETHLGFTLTSNLKEISFVRNVSTNKDMMRVSFKLNEEILFHNKRTVSEILVSAEECVLKKR